MHCIGPENPEIDFMPERGGLNACIVEDQSSLQVYVKIICYEYLKTSSCDSMTANCQNWEH